MSHIFDLKFKAQPMAALAIKKRNGVPINFFRANGALYGRTTLCGTSTYLYYKPKIKQTNRRNNNSDNNNQRGSLCAIPTLTHTHTVAHRVAQFMRKTRKSQRESKYANVSHRR